MARKRSEHYVNNKEFLAAIVEYKEKVALAAERGEAKPRITNYLGECFLKIATHLSFKPNFVKAYYESESPFKKPKPKMTKEMGYISNVKDARKSLEDIFKNS